MLRWLSKKMVEAGDRVAERDTQSFVEHLHQISDFQAANTLFLATVHRLKLEDSGLVRRALLMPQQSDLENMEQYLERSDAEGLIMKTINGLKAHGQAADASALRIWLVTMWSYRLPQLRPTVGSMWERLNRSLVESELALDVSRKMLRDPLPQNIEEEVGLVPPIFSSFVR